MCARRQSTGTLGERVRLRRGVAKREHLAVLLRDSPTGFTLVEPKCHLGETFMKYWFPPL